MATSVRPCHRPPLAYSLGLEFVRFRLCEKSSAGWFTEQDVFELELALMSDPEAGVLIPAAKVLRKLRRPFGGQGTRGGARIIYHHVPSIRQILVVYAYAKSQAGDLTPAQVRQLTQLVQSEFP